MAIGFRTVLLTAAVFAALPVGSMLAEPQAALAESPLTLAGAPAATEVPAPVVTPETIYEGESYTVSGTCPAPEPAGTDQSVYIDEYFVGLANADGTFAHTYSANPNPGTKNEDTGLKRLPAGDYDIGFTCEQYNRDLTSGTSPLTVHPGWRATTTATLDPDCGPGDIVDVTTVVTVLSPQIAIEVRFSPTDPLPNIVPLNGRPTADVNIYTDYDPASQTRLIGIQDLLEAGTIATIHSPGQYVGEPCRADNDPTAVTGTATDTSASRDDSGASVNPGLTNPPAPREDPSSIDPSPPNSDDPGPLANTGVQAVGMGGLGTALIVVGGFMLVIARKRPHTREH